MDDASPPDVRPDAPSTAPDPLAEVNRIAESARDAHTRAEEASKKCDSDAYWAARSDLRQARIDMVAALPNLPADGREAGMRGIAAVQGLIPPPPPPESQPQ